MNFKAAVGCASVFFSAFGFYLSTVIIKRAGAVGLDISASLFVFFRFALGFFVVVSTMAVRRQKIKIKKKRYLIGRALGNLAAVFFFYKGVELTSVAQANILNMTYPLFIAIFSWLFFKEQRDPVALGVVLVAFAGIWLILAPGKINFDFNSLWGLASGVSASFAIISLNLSRQHHDTQTILFFMFGIGLVLIFVAFYSHMRIPNSVEVKYLFWCSFFSIIAQYLLTIGFKYVTALEGGIISSTRILLAAVLGPFIAMDPVLSVAGWAGAFLIFIGNVVLTIRRART